MNTPATTGRVRMISAAALAVAGVAAAAGLAHAVRRAPESATVAVCDVFSITNSLLDSDRFKPARDAELERIKGELQPLAEDLQGMEERLKGMTPEQEGAQELYQQFQQKRQEYSRKELLMQRGYEEFFTTQYIEAWELVRASADAVGEAAGYSYVLACRKRDSKIEAKTKDAVIEAVLARQVLRSPEGADISEDVLADLKLE